MRPGPMMNHTLTPALSQSARNKSARNPYSAIVILPYSPSGSPLMSSHVENALLWLLSLLTAHAGEG